MVEMVNMEEMDVMECLVLKDHKDLQVNLVQQVDLQDLKASQEQEEHLDHEELLDPLDQGVEGWPTPGGERAPVQMLQELSWCIQAELEGVTINMVVLQTTCACP